MRILYGLLAGLGLANALLVVLAGGAIALAGPYGIGWMVAPAVLLWMAAGQPTTWAVPRKPELSDHERHFRGAVRITSGVLGVACGVPAAQFLIALGMSLPGASISSPMYTAFLLGMSVLSLSAVVAAAVLLRFAFTGRPLPSPRRVKSL